MTRWQAIQKARDNFILAAAALTEGDTPECIAVAMQRAAVGLLRLDDTDVSDDARKLLIKTLDEEIARRAASRGT